LCDFWFFTRDLKGFILILGYPVLDEGHQLGDGILASHQAWSIFTSLAKQFPTDEIFDLQQFLSKWAGVSN
jgi:hypothetical protein